MKDGQRFEHPVDTGYARHAVLAQYRVDHAVRPDQGSGVAECRAAGSFGTPDLEHDDGFSSVRGAFARLDEGRRSLDLFGEAADDAGLIVVDKVADVVGEIDVDFVAARDRPGDAETAGKQGRDHARR